MLQSETLHGIIPWIDGLSFVGIVTGVVKGSDWLDSMLNETGRKAISKWLKNVPSDAEDDSWPVALSGLIDRVFGERPFSLKFILRSFVASIIAVSIVWLVYARLQLRAHNPAEGFSETIVFSLLVSLIPDYLSLLISRAIINLIPRNPRLRRIVLLLVVDAALTAVISIVSLMPAWFFYLILLLSPRPGYGFTEVVKFWLLTWNSMYDDYFSLSAFNLGSEYPSQGLTIFFYSSFFTSVWLWLYVIAGFAIKASRKLQFLWFRLSKYLDIDKKPLGCIGKVSGLLLASLWAMFIGLEHALHYLAGH
jgi:hypothetical protein